MCVGGSVHYEQWRVGEGLYGVGFVRVTVGVGG